MKRTFFRSTLPRLLLLASFSATAFAYYHFVHFESAEGPFEPRLEKFDLDALLDGTVRFHVRLPELTLPKNDSVEALVSQIRQALEVWDSAPASALGVAFGGVREGPAPESKHPGGEILFEELPPGVLGLGGPVTRAEAREGFVPIVRSQVILSNDLTAGRRPRASFSELFFTSLVHEIGHALGLQHSLAGSAMSTDATRATTRALPLAADDIAGLSVLYPTSDFRRFFGSISGRVVTAAGEPVSLASVAAVSPRGAVVSALSRPGGRYRIQGLLPGPHLVYVQPLPPATQEGLGPANIVPPRSAEGFLPSSQTSFRTVFYGGSNRPEEALPVEVRFGAETREINFRVTPRPSVPLYNVTTYSFPGNQAPAVHPAFLSLDDPAGFVLAYGQGLNPANVLYRVEPLDRDVRVSGPQPYERDGRFLRIGFEFSAATVPGPKHLIFRTADDISVLPSGVRLTLQPAPVLYWVAEAPGSGQEGVWSVRGVNLHPASRVFFDGAEAEVLDFDAALSGILVRPPPGLPGHRAVVTVYNPDGQSSAFTLPDGNVTFRYPEGPEPEIRLSPALGAPGSDVLVEIEGRGTNFLAGRTEVGFGASGIAVRAVDVLGPERLRAVVTVRRGAAPGVYPVTVATGLEMVYLRDGFRVVEGPLNARGAPSFRFGSLVNSASMRPELSPGVLASLFGRNLTPETDLSAGNAPGRVRVTFNGEPARVLSANPRQINLQIPPSVSLGKAVVVVENARGRSRPLLAEISRVSPGLFGVMRPNGERVNKDAPARPGEELVLAATGLGAPYQRDGEEAAPRPPHVYLDGRRVKPAAIEDVAGVPGLYQVRFKLPEGARFGPGSGAVLIVEGRHSNWVPMPVAGAPAASAARSAAR